MIASLRNCAVIAYTLSVIFECIAEKKKMLEAFKAVSYAPDCSYRRFNIAIFQFIYTINGPTPVTVSMNFSS